METIQLQCGNCKNVMAISVAHLGQPVQCPHCRSVVQTPPPERSPEPEAAPSMESPPPDPAPPTTPVLTPTETSPPHDDDLTQFKPRARRDNSVWLVMALIFLVPYALTMTFFVVWLLIMRPGGGGDGLEYLRDPAPAPKQGGPRPSRGKRPPHDGPIAEKHKTILGKKVKAGDLEVTPLRVLVTKDGDLKLILRARNVAEKTAFEPMSLVFVNEKLAPDKLYTYLETRSKPLDPIYGGDLAFHKSREAVDEPRGFGVLGSGDENTITIITHEKYRARTATIVKSASDEFTWRVQVRRGFVKVDGKDVSATTVIGVDFSSKDIGKDGKS